MVRMLNDANVRRCVGIPDAIEALEEAYRERARGQVAEARLDVPLPNGWMRVMPCALVSSDVLGYKEFHLTRLPDAAQPSAAVRYTLSLFSYSTGELRGVVDAAYLTAIRTAAAAAVAARHMAPEGTSEVGVIGSGAEARAQVEAIAAVLPVGRASVYSRSGERRAAFARDLSEQLGIEVRPVPHPVEAIPETGTLVVATNTAGVGPALLGEWLHAGLHVSSIGSTSPRQREIDPEVWRRADRIVLDSRRVLEESGDALTALQEGAIDEARVTELHEVVAGNRPGRASPEELTLYKSIGMGMQDVAVADRALQRALALGVGTEVPDHQAVKLVEPN
jgi:ornithine cyclodeaminase/alanine dehydrogenase-like protein (mu-crystallin family)